MSEKHELLRSQKNQVFQALKQRGLPLEEFIWHTCASERTEDMEVPLLIHAPSTFFFVFDQQNGGDWVLYSPASSRLKEAQNAGDWGSTMHYVNIWAAALNRELTTPDLWAALKVQKQLAASSLEVRDNTPFSTAEQQSIAVAIHQLQTEFISATKATGERLHKIEQQTAYLVDASKRLGRKDFLLLLVGSLTSFVLEHTLASDAARHLFDIATKLLGWIGPTTPQLDV
jgi:hypothetical protein